MVETKPVKARQASSKAEPEQDVELDFGTKMVRFWKMVRNFIRENTSFDDSIASMDNYEYVDTQQYKNCLATCCEEAGLEMVMDLHETDTDVKVTSNGAMMLICKCHVTIKFTDGVNYRNYSSFGIGISRGGGHAGTIAITNALRNFITSNYMVPTSANEGDDIRQNAKEAKTTYMTEGQKEAKKEELLEKTANTVKNTTIMMGNTILDIAKKVIEHEGIEQDKKDKIVEFVAKYYNGDDPIPLDPEKTGKTDLWICEKKLATSRYATMEKWINNAE